jgi:dephospho-CoA kinase
MFVIGLTGGIGSGKSTVSQLLADLGAYVLDADKVGHQAYEPNTRAWRQVLDTFGEDLAQENGEIDRRKLGGIVFGDPSAMKKLTDIVWPRIYDMVGERIEEQKKLGTTTMVVEAAVLLEAKWTPLVDQVWVTVSSEDSVIRRLQERNGMTEEQTRSRMKSQMSSEERVKHADVVIHNDSGLEELKAEVAERWQGLEKQRG